MECQQRSKYKNEDETWGKNGKSYMDGKKVGTHEIRGKANRSSYISRVTR